MATGTTAKTAIHNLLFFELPQESHLSRDNEAEAAQLAAELPQQHAPLSQKTRYATSMRVQMGVLMHRFSLVYWRSPAYNVRNLTFLFKFGVVLLPRCSLARCTMVCYSQMRCAEMMHLTCPSTPNSCR